jgi:hypothetical protein
MSISCILPLPKHILKLISEYSKPVTRPDWRTFKRQIDTPYFIQCLEKHYIKKALVIGRLNMEQSSFYIAYHHIYYFGIQDYIYAYYINLNHNYLFIKEGLIRDVLSNKLLNQRNESYNNYEFMRLYGVRNYR